MKASEIPRDANGVKCEEGISYLRYMWHPTCPFCGLEDTGSKSGLPRPDPRHMESCRARPLIMLPCIQEQTGKDAEGKPVWSKVVRPGSFIGQVFTGQLRYPIRLIGKFRPKLPDGSRADEEIFWCRYQWRVVADAIYWVFTKEGWKPWFEVLNPEYKNPAPNVVWKGLRWQKV